MAYRVTAPFAYLKVKDVVTGAYTVQGLYEGAVVDDVEEENLQHHLDLNMVEKVGGGTTARATSDDKDQAGDDKDQAAKHRRS